MIEIASQALANRLNEATANLEIADTIKYLVDQSDGKIAFSTSFSYEDQVMTDIICTNNLPVRIFTLDTGRLFEETYKTLNRTRDHYNKQIDILFPDQQEVEELVSQKGPFSFYESVENRKQCCYIRKVVPLKRALENTVIWITGMRTGQSATRHNLHRFGFDKDNEVVKYNPLLSWTLDEVKKYINDHHVPYNPLQDRGFLSIGCEPCTRAVKPGEDVRAGRWWWEDNTRKECGIHLPNEEKK